MSAGGGRVEAMNDQARHAGLRSSLRTAGCLVAGVLCVAAFFNVALRYENFRFEYGIGINEIPPIELSFYAWYLLFGTLAVGFFAAGISGSSLPGLVVRAFASLERHRRVVLGLATLLLLVEVLTFQTTVLCGAPISDDESTYGFIAETLLHGRVVNPPPGDNPFFQNQFIVLDDHVWYGKYPIGHPLALALGEALGFRSLIVPLVTCASFLLTFAVGARLFAVREAFLGTLLLLVSPQFVFTGATQLSQPTGMLFLLLGMWSLLRLCDEGKLAWALLTGFAWGYGVLVRPLPGLLFLPVGAAFFLFRAWRFPVRRRWAMTFAAAVPLALCAAAFLAVNVAQTGDALKTGYQAVHGARMGALSYGEGVFGASIGGALLRQNVWLFGWPLSFLFVPLARRSRGAWLLWGMVAAAYAYRLIAPKTVLATTGPIYVAEIVPLLSLATGSGLFHLREWFDGWRVPGGAELIAATGVAFVLVMSSMFLPVQVREIHRSGVAWKLPRWKVDAARNGGPALVFAKTMVEPEALNTWAYFPPNPSPDLDDEVIFVRRPESRRMAEVGIDFWKRRFSDRRAWVLRYVNGQPVLHEVTKAQDFLGQ